MRIYEEKEIFIPKDVNLTELLHTNAGDIPLPGSHLIAKDSLTHRSLTIGELRSRAGRIAHGLNEAFRPQEGERWAMILPNCVEYIELFHALLWVGGVGCPINHALKADELAHALAVSRPKYIFAYSESFSRILSAISIAQKDLSLQNRTWATPEIMTVIGRVDGYKRAPDDYLSEKILPIPHDANTESKIASIHLSSGTTGKPKGIQLTHYNFVANCYQLYQHDPAQFHPQTRIIAFTPFVHIAMTTPPLFFGPWTGIMHHAMPSFSLEEFGKLVTSTRPTSFQGVATVALAFANTDFTQRYDFSAAEVISCGGAPMSQELCDRLTSRAPWQMVQLYGMTEAAPYVAYQKLGEKVPAGSIGHLLPNIKAVLKIENTLDDAPEGGPGELWLAGPNIAKAYVENPEANKTAFPMPGWYNTGDVCTISKEGLVSVVGRTKELIKYKGFQVSPPELEAKINGMEGVVEAGVGSIWDESQLTELPTAYVILEEQVRGETEQRKVLRRIQVGIDEAVTGYKKLRGGVWAVSALPKNPTGKLLRKQFREYLLGPCSLDMDVRARL